MDCEPMKGVSGQMAISDKGSWLHNDLGGWAANCEVTP